MGRLCASKACALQHSDLDSGSLSFCALKGLDQEEMAMRGYVYPKYPGFTIDVVKDDACPMSWLLSPYVNHSNLAVCSAGRHSWSWGTGWGWGGDACFLGPIASLIHSLT